MFAWIARADDASACNLVTPLLSHLAPDFAPRLALLWPAPHRPFIEAPSERRHLACLALARRDLTAHEALVCLGAPFRRAVRELAPEAPAGLAAALARLGEVAWSADDYGRLTRLLAGPGTSQVLRHRREINPEYLAALDRLAPALHAAGLGRFELTADQAGLLTELYGALVKRDGQEGADAAARRWAAADGVKDVTKRAIASVRRPLSAPPFAARGHLKPIVTLAELDEAGGRFKNCLGSLSYAGDPDYAWCEWLGEPGAMIELRNDRLYGWTLIQARFERNATVAAAQRDSINSELRAAGVHVGYETRDLVNALSEAGSGRLETTEATAIGWCYGD
jgi:hypothetical protein